jgi:TolB-like protein
MLDLSAVFPFEDLSSRKELGIFCRSFSGSDYRAFPFPSVQDYQIYFTDVSPRRNSGYIKGRLFCAGRFPCQNEIVLLNVQLCNIETKHLVWGNKFEGKLN